MSTYQQKKKHIYAYRRRKRALKYINELEQIIEQSSKKDLKRMEKRLGDLRFNVLVKLGYFGDYPKLVDEARKTALERKIEKGESRLANPVARYICPMCGKSGFLFSPILTKVKLTST